MSATCTLVLCEMIFDELSSSSFCIKIENMVPQGLCTSCNSYLSEKYIMLMQGRDKECILVSFVRSSKTPRNSTSSLLGDWHRINVALTRAKVRVSVLGLYCNM